MKVELLDKMGSDLTVVNAARVSYAKHHEEFQRQRCQVADKVPCWPRPRLAILSPSIILPHHLQYRSWASINAPSSGGLAVNEVSRSSGTLPMRRSLTCRKCGEVRRVKGKASRAAVRRWKMHANSMVSTNAWVVNAACGRFYNELINEWQYCTGTGKAGACLWQW